MRASSLRLALALVVLWVSPVSRAGDVFDRWEDTALYDFEYRVPLDGIPLGDKAHARLWVPMPVDSDSQRVLESRVESPIPIGESLDAMGNRMAHLSWEGPVPAGAEVVFHYTVERAPDDGLSREEVSASRDYPARFLAPVTRIPLEGMIKRLGEKHAEGSETDADKIRAYYDFVLKYMRYSKHGEGWGQGDASWACNSRYGNCTDFHSLFLGMARSQKIPARFVMGFPIAHDS
ncbi:MAG: transglutaminase domain-containing protein, partial [Myxococcota bacterium]